MASPAAGRNFMMSPAIWLFSWFSFQVPTKGFWATAVLAAASETNTQSVADNQRPDRTRPPFLGPGGEFQTQRPKPATPPHSRRRRSAVHAIRALLLFHECGLEIVRGG